MTRLTGILVAACLLLLPAAAHANLILTFGSGPTINPGQEGYLDVSIHSDGSDLLDVLMVTYQISGPGLAFFVDGSGFPDEPQLSDPSYVFYGNSVAFNSGVGGGGAVGTTTFSNDTYTQSDLTADSLPVSIGSTDFLLARLHFVATTPGPYTISVASQESGNSGFLGDDFIDFSVSNDGDVRVADFDQSPAVPEPTSLVLWCGLGALALKRWRTAVSW